MRPSPRAYRVARSLSLRIALRNGYRVPLPAGWSPRLGFYSADRRLTVATDVTGRATVYGYDSSSGLLTHIQRPVTGVTNDVVYDARRRAVEVKQTAGDGQVNITRIEYPDATTRRVTDPTGQIFTFRLDDHGQIAERVDPNGDTYSVTRDAAGRPITRTDPAGGATTRTGASRATRLPVERPRAWNATRRATSSPRRTRWDSLPFTSETNAARSPPSGTRLAV